MPELQQPLHTAHGLGRPPSNRTWPALVGLSGSDQSHGTTAVQPIRLPVQPEHGSTQSKSRLSAHQTAMHAVHENPWPHRPTDEELVQMFSLHMPRPQRFLLERSLLAGTLADFWTEADHLTMLRQHCALCGTTMHPADLVLHLYEAHQCGQDLVTFLKQQLINKFIAKQATDSQCYACLQVFHNTQQSDTGLTPTDWNQALHAHFRAQCPCLLQTAVILAKSAHGRLGHAGHRRGEQPGLECLSGNWPPAGQTPDPSTQSSGAQATKKRRLGQTARQAPSQPVSRQNQRGSSIDAPDKTGSPTGQGHAATEDRRHIYLLLRAQGAQQQPTMPSPGHRRLGSESPNANTEEAPDAAETTSHAGSVQHAHEQTDGSRGGQGWLRDSNGSSQEPNPLAGQDVPVFGMGPVTEAAEGQSKTTPELDQTDADLHRHGGSPDGCPPGDLLSCPADDKSRSGPMEAHFESENRHSMATDADHVALSHMVVDGNIAETSWATPKPTSPQPAAGHGSDQDPQGQGERETQRHDSQTGMSASVDPVDSRELLQNLAHLVLQNPGHYCFANAATYCFLWTTLSMTPCDLHCWGEQRQMLIDFIQSHHETHANLCDEFWFQNILRCWGRLNPSLDFTMLAQQDAAEFVASSKALPST